MALNIQARAGASANIGTFDDFINEVMTSLGNSAMIGQFEEFMDAIAYRGFDASVIRSQAMAVFPAASILKLVTIGALRGSAAASLDPKSGGDGELQSVNIPTLTNADKSLSGLFRSKILFAEKNSSKNLGKRYLNSPCTMAQHLTIQRLVAAFPDMAAYGLMQVEKRGILGKRVPSKLPAWLIFPAAASLPFHGRHMADVQDMCQKFSNLIGGRYDENIFKLQWANKIPFGNNAIHSHLKEMASINEVDGVLTPFTLVMAGQGSSSTD
jgi:hypothetical protein